jgi:nicotinamidase-related amidase
MHSFLKNRKDIELLKTQTLALIKALNDKFIVVTAPIGFDKAYSDLVEPYGILKTINDQKAFLEGTNGFELIPELKEISKPIVKLKTRRTLNAFQHTDFYDILQKNGVNNLYLTGIFTSLCIDSTARTAYELGFNVHIMRDLIAGKDDFENDYYIKNILPLYSYITTAQDVLENQNT